MTTTYDRLTVKSQQLNETNDCAIKAVAIITGEDYEVVLASFTKYGRVPKKGAQFSTTSRVLRDFGYQVNIIPNWRKLTKARTVRVLSRNLRGFKGTLLVRTGGRTSGHILTFKDGKVQDWTENRLNRIREIYMVKEAV